MKSCFNIMKKCKKRSSNSAEAPTSRCQLKWKANIVGKSPRKSFDITKAAGGVAKAHVKTLNVTVTENYLEIHLFWAGKVTCCIPKQGYYGPLIAAVHVVAVMPKPN